MDIRSRSFRIPSANPVSTMESVCLWHPTTQIWVVLTVPCRWPCGEGVKWHFEAQHKVGTRSFLAKNLLDPLQAGSGDPLPIVVWEHHRSHHHLSHTGVSQSAEARVPLSTFTASVMLGPTRQKTKGRGAGGWACSTPLCPEDFRSHSAWVCDKLKYKWGRGLLNGGQKLWGLFWNNFLHNISLSKIPLTNCNKTLIGTEPMIPSFLVIWIFHVYLYSQ